MMLIFQPVRSEARRTFWPPRPMAMARFSSSTTTSIACFSSSTTIDDTLAGASAPITNCAGSSLHSTMSTRSPASSLVTRVDAGAAHADAGADRVDALVVRQHGDLGARAGVAGAALDLQQALLDLGHFLAEQLDHEFGRRARQDDRRAAQRQVDFHDHGAHAVAVAQVFLGDHLAAAQAAFDAAGLDDDVALVHALDGADEDLVAARHEVVEQHLALGVADLLQDDLLGRHRADAADRHRLDRLPRCTRRPRCRRISSLASNSRISWSGSCRPASSGTTCQRRKVS